MGGWGALVLALAGGCHGAPIGGPNGCSEVQGSCKSSSSCLDYAGYDPTSLATIEQGCGEMSADWSTSPCDAHRSEGGCEIIAGDVCIVAWAFPPTMKMMAQSACANGALGNLWLAPPP